MRSSCEAPETIEETAVHRAVTEDADGSGVGVGKDRLGAVLIADFFEALPQWCRGLRPHEMRSKASDSLPCGSGPLAIPARRRMVVKKAIG